LLFGMSDCGQRLMVMDCAGARPATVIGDWTATDWSASDMEPVAHFLVAVGHRADTTPVSGRLA
jgi:hypothetical protein